MDRGRARGRGLLISLLICLALWALIILFGRWVYGWEELTLWDYQTGGVNNVTPYYKWDSQEGMSYGYVYDYRSDYNWIPPAERELERQELRREDWWDDDYKEWLYDQGLTRGDTIGW